MSESCSECDLYKSTLWIINYLLVILCKFHPFFDLFDGTLVHPVFGSLESLPSLTSLKPSCSFVKKLHPISMKNQLCNGNQIGSDCITYSSVRMRKAVCFINICCSSSVQS